MYAIPVYVTNDYQQTDIKAYDYNANTGKFERKNITLDIDSQSKTFRSELPNLVQISFARGTYTFGTVITDATGNTMYAVIKDGNGYKQLAGEEVNKDGNKYQLVPAYVAGLVKDGDTLQTVKEGEVTYYVMDMTKMPQGRNFPAGTIAWDTEDFEYDWQGSTTWKDGEATNSIKVGYSYQWGSSNTVKNKIEITAKNYKISRLTSMTDANGNKVSLSSESDKKGNYTTVLNIDALGLTTDDLVGYLNGFNQATVKYVAGANTPTMSLEWDLTALQEALKSITGADGTIDYYKGLEATVKAKVGGDRFSISSTVTQEGLVTNKTGFVGSETTYEGVYAQEVSVKIVVKGSVFSSLNTALTFDAYSAREITGDALGAMLDINFAGSDTSTKLPVGDKLQVKAPYVKIGDNYVVADGKNGGYAIGANDLTFEGYKATDYPLYAQLTIGTEFSGKQVVYVPITVSTVAPTTYNVDVAHEDTFNPTWYNKDAYKSFDVSFGTTTKHTMYPDWSTVNYYTNAKCTTLKPDQNIYSGGTIYAQVQAYVYEKDENGEPMFDKPLGLVDTGTKDENGNKVFKAQTITLKLNVEQQSIMSVKFFYDAQIGDVNALTDAEREQIKDKLTDKANYTGTVYGQTHVIGSEAFGIDALEFAKDPSKYFRTGAWGDINGTIVLVNLKKGTYSGKRYTIQESLGGEYKYDEANDRYILATASDTDVKRYAFTQDNDGDYKYEIAKKSYVKLTAGEKGESYLAYVQGWTTKIESSTVTGRQTIVYAVIGNNDMVPIYIRVPDYTVQTISFKNGTLVQNGDVANKLTLTYDVMNAWQLPSTATVTVKEGAKAFDTEVFWDDNSSPNKDELRKDENGVYVVRNYHFFDNLSVRYPQTGSLGAKVYLDNYDINVTITPDGQAYEYNVFSSFKFASTATVTKNGVDYPNVPLKWVDKSMPTAEEIKAGKFTRKAYVAAFSVGEDGTMTPVYKDFEFKINNGFTLDGIDGNYADGFAITREGAAFFLGLPRASVVNVNGERIEVALAWSDAYTKEAGFNGDMTLTIASKWLTSTVTANVTVKGESIDRLKDYDGTPYSFDPFWKEGNFFRSGEVRTIVTKGSALEADVTVTYSLADIDPANLKSDADFYANVSKYFGRKYTIGVTYTYFGGADVMTETGTIDIAVGDRTILFVSDYAYRAILVDTFLYTDASYLERELWVATAGVWGDVLAYFDWTQVDALIKDRKSDSKHMATVIVGIESADGQYVYQDIYGTHTDENGNVLMGDGKKEYVTIDEYLEAMRKVNADFELTNEKRYHLAMQKVNVPVTVLDRTVVDAELFMEGTGLTVTNTEEKYSTITDTLVGEVGTGRYIDIVYDKNSGMPTEYVYYNQFAYIGGDKLPHTMILTFASGEKGEYYITYDNAPTSQEMKNISKTLERTMTVHVWNTNPAADENAFKVMPSFEMKIKVHVSKVTVFNSDIAYENMSVGEYRYTFNPYTSEDESLFNTDNYDKTFTYYVDGQFMTAQNWWSDGRTVDANEYRYTSAWTKRHNNYNVYTLAGSREGTIGEFEQDVVFYTVNKSTKTYTRYTGVVKYDATDYSYKTTNDENLYVFVYVTTQTLDATWNTKSAEYGYKGGNTTVKATVSSEVNGNSATATINVTVNVKSGESTPSAFDGATETELTYWNASANAFVIDPFRAVDGGAFARVSGYTGDRYEKSSTATSGYVKNNLDGTYMLVKAADGTDTYVEIPTAQLDRTYKYFPSKISVTLEDGQVVSVPVTWDFGGVNVSYQGGNYTAYAILNHDGEYNYQDNKVGEQRIQFAVKVLDRSAQSVKTTSALTSLKGFVKSGQDYINPYDYQKPTMPTTLTVNIKTYNADGSENSTEERTYSVANNTLAWNFDKFRPSYEGGAVYVTAKLYDVDGNVQKYDIPFLVQRMYATQIKSISSLGVEDGIFNSTVTNSKTDSDFTFNPYKSDKLVLPIAYKVTFAIFNPVYDNGNVTWNATNNGTSTVRFNYTLVSMPASTSYTVKAGGITSTVDGQSATIKLGTQERLTVDIKVSGSKAFSGTQSVSASESGLSVIHNGASVAWFGRAYVYDMNGGEITNYAVTLSTAILSSDTTKTILPSTFGARKVVYKLYAAVGTVIDATGKVVTTKTATASEGFNTAYVKVGQEIPAYQALSNLVTMTYENGTWSVQ